MRRLNLSRRRLKLTPSPIRRGLSPNPTAEPQGQQEKASTGEKPVIAAPRAKDKAKSSNANPISVKKPVAQRSA